MNVCVYACRRNKISATAHSKWPGNDIPKFQRNKKMQAELNELVEKLYPDCKEFYSKRGIRDHILVTMTERRRQVKRGYNYEEVNWYE